MKAKIRVGIIGLGRMGMLHFRNVMLIDGVSVEAVADKSKKKLTKANSLGVKNLFTDFNDMINQSSLDAVIISLPHFLHENAAIFSAEKGFHIFIEKPLGRTSKECERIIKAAHKNGIKLCVDHSYRYFENVRIIKERYDKGYLGEVGLFTSALVTNGPFAHPIYPKYVQDWWLDPKLSGGGALLALAPHLIDLFEWFFKDTEFLSGSFNSMLDLDYEDTASLTIRSKKTGTIGTMNVGWFERSIFPSFDFYVELHGTGGFISSNQLAPKNIYMHGAKESTKNIFRRLVGKKIKPLMFTYYYNSYYQILEDFFNSVRNDLDVPIPCEDSLKTIKIIEAAYRQGGFNYK